ncbi:flagellar basal body rod C-terminal domain-containing protein, partial [Aquabacterium sp.]|uniref:flagellar basal body rod C-terminal domain-containing protein n=1 Tax=Aquabacterium sp. TaxID=1872578 RepID=UPI002BCC32FB
VSAARLDSGAQLMGDDKALGTLRIVALPKETQVMALGDGLYETSTAVDGLPTPESVSIHAGHIEVSNVVASQEMVHLMTTMRHAESMVKLIQGADELLEKAIRKLGDMS